MSGDGLGRTRVHSGRTDRFRIVIVRTDGLFKRWRWALEEQWRGGEWSAVEDGYTLTRSAAGQLALARCGKCFGIDRVEAAVVVRYKPTPPREMKPSPLPPELLSEDGEQVG